MSDLFVLISLILVIDFSLLIKLKAKTIKIKITRKVMKINSCLLFIDSKKFNFNCSALISHEYE